MKSKNLLSAAIALLLLVEVAISLSPAARESLTKAIPGVDLEALRERLQSIGEKDFSVKNGTAAEPVDDSPTADLDAIVMNPYTGYRRMAGAQLKETEANSGVQNFTRRKRQWANSLSARWTDNILYYSFAAGVPAKTKSVVKQALNYMQARTCVGFIENATAENRVEVFVGQGCYSALGMDDGIRTRVSRPTEAHALSTTLVRRRLSCPNATVI
ncbi:unnamed protein product [Nippostrongylus brasiliensis]|uniref:Astacin domain-containing protein n=1 Tax=Nippostrongylus brasiliensis TaxID=27835 RepID=A0A0N4YGW6_NIPBR|nr:unnamed protein product [Nippostrongylus brasiliensis]